MLLKRRTEARISAHRRHSHLHSTIMATLALIHAPFLMANISNILYTAPTAASILSSSPLSSNLTMPPLGPSLQPPRKSAPIHMAGTEVLPMIPAISARSALPSSTSSISMTVYLAFFASRIAFALTQKGHRTNDKNRTGSLLIKPFNLALVASTS